jgi:hypothetical protein
MPVRKITKENFTYIAFRRSHPGDTGVFKREMENIVSTCTSDIIVDLSREPLVTDGEMAVLVRAAKALQETNRTLRVMVAPANSKRLEAKRLHNEGNIAFYNDYSALLKVMNSPEKVSG